MKKFTKILLGFILSVAMVVTGGLAFLNNNDAYAKSSLLYAGHGVISTSTDGATVEHGTYAQITSKTEFTGIKLAGPTGSTFDLGTVDIGKSDWAGTATATAPSNDTDKNESLLEFVYNPSKTVDKAAGEDVGNAYVVHFIFTQNEKVLDVYSTNYGHLTETSAILFAAKANGQSKNGAYRYGVGWKDIPAGINRKQLLKDDAANMGLTLTKDANINALGISTAPNMIYYDFNDKALYSPLSYGNNTQLDNSKLIRDLDADDATNGPDKTWSGFTKDANGKCLVNVTVTFEEMLNNNSVVITKLGSTVFDYSKTANEVFDNDSEVDVVKGVTATNGTVKYGTYAQSVSGKEYTGINLIGGKGSKFNLGTMSINDTYFDDEYTFVKGTGVVDSGTGKEYISNASKYLAQNDKNNKGETKSITSFIGTNEAVTGVASNSRSFLSFVINPTLNCDNSSIGVSFFKVTLREKGNFDNFVTYHIRLANYGAGAEFLITCTATNNSFDTAERLRPAGITLHESVRRVININGSQPFAVSLYYDLSQQSAYTNLTSSLAGDLKGCFRIRDFNDFSATNSNYDLSDEKMVGKDVNYWKGFSQDAEVEISLEMTGLHNASAQNSIILTDLGGYDFDVKGLSTVPEVNFLEGTEVDLGKAVCYDTKTSSYIAPSSFVETLKYKVNGNEVNRFATLSNGDVITVYDKNGVQIGGEINAVAKELTWTINAVNGSREIEGEGVQIGSVIKFIPGRHKTSNLFLSDVRSVIIGETTYSFNENTNKNDANLTLKGEGEDIYYEYEVKEEDIVGTTFNIEVTFDRWCKITFTDTEKQVGEQETVKHAWSTIGGVAFPLDTAKNGKVLYRGSSTDKDTVLVAWARTDAAVKKEDGTFEPIRFDYNVGDYNSVNQNLTYYSSRALGDASDGGKNFLTIVPNMTFETIYVKMWIEAEIKLESGKTDDYSGLRFVVKFDRNDVDNYLKYYGGEANDTLNPFGAIRNYITTLEEIKGGKNLDDISKIDVTQITAEDFYKDKTYSWEDKNKVNGLGLVNGTGATKEEMTGKYGYIHYKFDGNGDIWNEKICTEDYYAYALTVSGFKMANIEKHYVFIPFVNIAEINGSTTAFVMNAVTYQPKELAKTKLNEVLKTSADETDLDITIMEGETKYYSNYTLEDIQWLAQMAGSERVFTAGAIEEQA